MGRLRSRFRGLQWRLTLSYTLLTVAAVLAIGVTFVTLVNRFIFDSSVFPAMVASDLTGVAPQATPYLLRNPVDQAGLRRWLMSDEWARSMRLPYDVGLATGSGGFVAVVDRTGRVVAAAYDRPAPGEPLADRLSPAGRAVLQAALAGELDQSRLAIHDPNGTLAAAAPIVGPDGQTIGALVAEPDVGAVLTTVWTRALSGFLLGAIVLTVVFGALGTLFGYAWVRWLTGRLRVLTDAVEAWGRGDLDVVARDASDDEIGRLARQLNSMAEQLRGLLEARQALAIVEERQRLARDLHDAVKQQVFATAMQVGAARALLDRDAGAAKEHLVEAERLATDAQQELTALIRELRPAALVDKGLVGALGDWVRDWSRQTKIAAEVRAQGTRATPLAIEQAIFRVAQEALANVAKHSGATAVELQLVWQGDSLELSVSDNGHGFPVDRAAGKGMGLSTMRERVEALGGTLRVESSAEGTQAEAWVPMAGVTATAQMPAPALPSPFGRGRG
jgi:NarL family two-component system sensor histidine kinase LiaS